MKQFGTTFKTTATITDLHVKCDDALMRHKARLATAWIQDHGGAKTSLPKPNPFGAISKCVFGEVLPYFNMVDMMVVPASHGFLRGVVFDLWLYIFDPLSYKPRPPAPRFKKTSRAGGTGRSRRGGRGRRARAARARARAQTASQPQDEATFTEGYR